MLLHFHKISIEEEDEGGHSEEKENVKDSEHPTQLKSVPAETEESDRLTEAPPEIKIETLP